MRTLPLFSPSTLLAMGTKGRGGVLYVLETARHFDATLLIVRKYQSNELKSLSVRDETYHRSSLQCPWYISVVKTAQGHQSSHPPLIFLLPPSPSLLLRTDNHLFTGWLTRILRAEENLLGVSRASRESHHSPLAFVPSGTRSAQVPEAFSASTHQTMRTRTTGQVTTKLPCTSQHGSNRRYPSDPHGTLRHRGTWYAADRCMHTQRKPQNMREEKPYGTTR